MDREQIAATLEEIGLLLELLGENPFKTRAYDNGARVIRGLDRDVSRLTRRSELTQIRGIGAALADKIATLVETGKLPYLEELHQKVPRGLLDWLKIPGLGAKKARAIHVALGITTLDELEAACKEEKLRELPGFGATSEAKLLRGIGRLRRRSGRFLQPLVQQEASRLLAVVRAVPGVLRAEVGGSVRRCAETSKDIDLLVAAGKKDAEAVMDAFAGAEGVVEVTGRGPTKCSVRLAAGPAADLRVVDDRAFPFALVYFTGNKAHNIVLRARAQKRGLKLNEYALEREKSGRKVACRDEDAIYAKLGLEAAIPPELREDQGEIEAAEEGRLPQLLEARDLKGILHVHSTWSDGRATLEELATEAEKMRMGYVAICDHSQAAVYARGLDPKRLREQGAAIDALNRKLDGRLRILKGIEVDILPDGTLDLPDDVLAELDLVVAAVHSALELDEDKQTARMLRALDNPYVDVLAHVTGRILLQRDGYPLDLNRVLDAAAERGVAVEINAHPKRLDLDWRDLRYGLKQGLKTCINPDAHSTAALHHVAHGVGVARKAWCTKDDVLNALPLARLTRHLRERRA